MAQITVLQNQPGIQRDGTDLDSNRYNDGQWVRFQRGRPKKMGGMRRITDQVNGPVYGTHVWTRQSQNLITLFSGNGVEQIQVNNDFIGAAIYDRTPAGWVSDSNLVWQYTTLFDSAAGSDKTLLICHASDTMENIDDGTARDIFYGNVSDSSQLQAFGPEWQVSGGVVAIAPYLVAYGSDGKVIWSNQNEPRNATTGDAGTARVTDKKIVKGLQVRGTGKSPAALLWSIDSVIKMSYIGGPAVFEFDTITSESSVMSSRSIVEYDGNFYWIGVDRFLMFNGAVQEIPNDTNFNFFFDNLNFKQRQKVFALKVPRFGEIWWFYPSGTNDECDRAVIFNVREKIWYDVELGRTSGSSSHSVRYPVMVDNTPLSESTRLVLSSPTGSFLIGDTVTGDFSHASGTVIKVTNTAIYLSNVSGTFRYDPTETITGTHGTATVIAADPTEQYALWLHEIGYDKVVGDNELSIKAFIETTDFSLLTGGPATPGDTMTNVQTRIARLELDFILNGPLTVNVVGEATAASPTVVSRDFVVDNTTQKLDLREQRRIIRLRFTSDSANGHFEMGKNLIIIEPGDEKI